MEIKRIVADDLSDIDREKIGLKGSPTKVRRTFVPEVKKGGTIFTDGLQEDNVRSLAQLLIDNEIVVSVE